MFYLFKVPCFVPKIIKNRCLNFCFSRFSNRFHVDHYKCIKYYKHNPQFVDLYSTYLKSNVPGKINLFKTVGFCAFYRAYQPTF